MMLETLRSRLDYQAVTLGLVALITSAALSVTNRQTHESIAEAEARDLQASLHQVLPDGFSDNELLKDTVTVNTAQGDVTVYRARKGTLVRGVIYQMTGRGYSGPISLVMAVDRDGHILGVRITKHTETPGLGDKIELDKSDWIRSFVGKYIGNPPPPRWAVKKDGGDFDQFTGATITPRAVVNTVHEGLAFFTAHRERLLEADAAPQSHGSDK
jgi:electron transport complex protein RnfG